VTHYACWYGSKHAGDSTSGIRVRRVESQEDAVAFLSRRMTTSKHAETLWGEEIRHRSMAASDHFWVSWERCDCTNNKHGADLVEQPIEKPTKLLELGT